MKYVTIALTAFLLVLNGCNPTTCHTDDNYCNEGPIKKLFEEHVVSGERRFAIHYVLVSGYNRCCSGKIDYMNLANRYKDTTATKYPVSGVIFIKSEEDFWSNEMMPDDESLFRTGLAKIIYHYQDSIVGRTRNVVMSFYSY